MLLAFFVVGPQLASSDAFLSRTMKWKSIVRTTLRCRTIPAHIVPPTLRCGFIRAVSWLVLYVFFFSSVSDILQSTYFGKSTAARRPAEDLRTCFTSVQRREDVVGQWLVIFRKGVDFRDFSEERRRGGGSSRRTAKHILTDVPDGFDRPFSAVRQWYRPALRI
jgi:hypothetical protein